MLESVSRFALLVSLVALGCSVPTPVGELQQAGASVEGTSSADEPTGGAQSSTSAASVGSSSTAAASSSGDGAIAPEMTAFAIRRGDLPGNDPGATGTNGSGVGTGSDGDPDDLLVTIGFTTASCEDPNAADPCQTWTATLVLTPAQQVTGTYTDSEFSGFVSEQGPAEDNGDCPGSGGTLIGFTVIIESIDETGLELVFEGNGIGPSALDLNGMSFSIPRC